MPDKNLKINLNKFSYQDLKIGDEFSFERKIEEVDVKGFADLSGDYSPLHTDPTYAKSSEFGERIVHGMFLGSLFSTLIGMLVPGEKALYLSQDLKFVKPVLIGETVFVEGRITSKTDALKIITLQTEIKNQKGEVAVSGTARVKVRE
ncbi:MAG: MaoC family dehydratase [Candidatus Paceibacterota bacterium]|jgi:3-hydroxybutyryl-CoA dehydratase